MHALNLDAQEYHRFLRRVYKMSEQEAWDYIGRIGKPPTVEKLQDAIRAATKQKLTPVINTPPKTVTAALRTGPSGTSWYWSAHIELGKEDLRVLLPTGHKFDLPAADIRWKNRFAVPCYADGTLKGIGWAMKYLVEE